MNRIQIRAVLFAALSSVFSGGVGAQTLLEKIESVVAEGAMDLSLRARFETVEQDNALSDASAATLRARMTFRTGVVNGISGLLEFDNVSSIGADHYDSLIRDKYRGTYSIIADPVGSEVNQAYIRYSPDESQSFKLGMQRVNHAAQRFIGSVGWRQNEQTLDAISYSKSGERFSLDYSYVWNVNRIFGTSKSSVQATNLESDSHIAYASYQTDKGTFAGFVYALDFSNASALSSLTTGISYAHTFSGLVVNGSVARQSDYGRNLIAYNSTYVAADVAYNFERLKLLVGYESLGSDSANAAFQTPLATLHKWQGWSDLFLTTPAAGLEDAYVSISGNLGDASLSATYHRFTAEQGSMRYGSEWDLIASYPLRDNLNMELKYADYDAEGLKVDTNRIWFSLSWTF